MQESDSLPTSWAVMILELFPAVELGKLTCGCGGYTILWIARISIAPRREDALIELLRTAHLPAFPRSEDEP